MRGIPAALAVLLLGATGAKGAMAQELPCAQVRLVVPYPAGGATDVASRVVAERLEAALKKPVIVENRGGATGNIGTVAVVNAPPDGCTLLVNATVIATFVHSFAKLGYDPIKDLAPVGGVGITPVLFVAAPQVPAGNIKELVELSKSRPDGLNYSSAGYGLQQHLAAEEIAQRTGAKFTHVAYRGGGPAMTDLIAARLDFGAFLAGTTKPLIADGKLKALAIAQDRRSELLPDVPTTAEQGLPGMSGGTHFMVFAPPATPKPVIALISAELHKVIAAPALRERFQQIGFEATPMTAAEVAAEMQRTGERYAPLIKRLNIRLE
ncbi:MAG: tripartite tricarboxylate transporter substrate binding protein [Xanthobacteraceae bacterium]|nr:tripartite tricarboxylate transporter substrate binding protein [Xanthobacteraceae bacterium]